MTDTTKPAPADLDARSIANATKRYEDKLAALAQALHDLARDVQRNGKSRPSSLGGDGQDDYLYAAQGVIHTLHWGIANLNADQLLDAAADAHSAIRGQVK